MQWNDMYPIKNSKQMNKLFIPKKIRESNKKIVQVKLN